MSSLPSTTTIPKTTWLGAFTALLQDRDRFIQEIIDGVDLKAKLRRLAMVSGASFALYGLIMGSGHSFLQGISAAIKLPILFLLTIAICMPALYIFSSFFGSKRSALQTFVLLLASAAIMGTALVGLAPVSLFFILTTDSYQFFKLLNVSFFLVAGLLGVMFLSRFHDRFSEETEPMHATRALFLRLWYLLYGFVGTQLAWTLRPFFGAPDLPLEIVRDFGGNFYTNVLTSLGHLLGGQ